MELIKMWITATKGIEKTEAVRRAIPKIEEMLGKKINVDEVMELVLPELDKLQRPLPDEDWKTVDWDKRKDELAKFVPMLYMRAVETIGEYELEKRREEKRKLREEWSKHVRTF